MSKTTKYILSEIDQVAAWLIDALNGSKLVALHGNMGVGKTTLVSAICRYLKVEDGISSPTFSIINEYCYAEKGIKKSIYHIDLYRLKDEEEAINTGVEDCLYSGDYCFVEWPEKAPLLLPENTVHVYLRVEGATSRSIEIITTK